MEIVDFSRIQYEFAMVPRTKSSLLGEDSQVACRICPSSNISKMFTGNSGKEPRSFVVESDTILGFHSW